MTEPLDFNDAEDQKIIDEILEDNDEDQEDDLTLDDLPGQAETEVLFQRLFDAVKDFIRDYRTTLTGEVNKSDDLSLIIVHGKDNDEDEG